jgi:tRNA-(ms[2]io[6]A)-hydroxylase
VLNLAAPTDPRWAAHALAHLDELLVDHAHCERKAAATARSLMRRYPQHEFLHEPLSRLAREEVLHFEEVRRRLEKRGLRFRGLRAGPYATRLRAAARSFEPARLLDLLLCCALIEARSGERLRLLADVAPDPELADLYRGLLAAEARHHHVFVELAQHVAPADAVRTRLRELAAHEARVLSQVPPLPRMHGGAPRAGASA